MFVYAQIYYEGDSIYNLLYIWIYFVYVNKNSMK